MEQIESAKEEQFEKNEQLNKFITDIKNLKAEGINYYGDERIKILNEDYGINTFKFN
jgi:hypothetical protein